MDGCKPYLYKLIGIKDGQEFVAMISENYALVKEFAEEFCFEGYRIEVIKEQDELTTAGSRQSDVLIEALKECQELEAENNKLKQVINEAGIIKCCKCGEYHNKHYVCWHCGYDYTAPKE